MTAAHPARRKKILIFSQVFIPDPASVGQHIADVATELARRGHTVLVYAANRGYENPNVRYPLREYLNGVRVRRLPFSSFGKRNLLTRILGTATFLIQCIFLGLFTPQVDGIVFSTSPPLIGVAAVIARMFRGVPIVYWAMDLNPDQLIAMGKLRPREPLALLLEGINQVILRRSSLVVALDRFMAARLLERDPRLTSRMLIVPPWPHEEHIEPIKHEENPFRRKYGLNGKFVIMYSGNHSPANPLNTLLDAALQLRDDPDLRFLFVGGGLLKKDIEAFIARHNLANSLSLPYQPLSELAYSLSAADVHAVSLGEQMIGIIHPCKIYGAMAVGRPILYLGPRPSHISDILERESIGWQVSHGDTASAVSTIQQARHGAAGGLKEMGCRAQHALERSLSQTLLCSQLCDRTEAVLEQFKR